MYQFDSYVRYSEVGPDKNLTLPGIINYFQDCSTFQSEGIGLGLDYLEHEKRAWILNSWQIVIERYPHFGDKIITGTWAYSFKGIYGSRNFLIQDEAGHPFAYANSIWIYLDTETSHMVRIPKEAADLYGYEEKYPMDYAPRKIKLPEHLQTQEGFPVISSNLDTNNHVNNGQYIQMAQAYLPPDFPVKQMRAEYRSSAYLGDLIIPKVALYNHTYLVTLCHPDDTIYAIVEFTRKDS
ncbi:MAG: thioesterase [Acetivibrio sp.]